MKVQHFHGENDKYITRIIKVKDYRTGISKEYIEFICEYDGKIYRRQEITL